MTLSKQDENKIHHYLQAVRERLSNSDAEETLAGIESHIYEAVAAKEASGEEGDLVSAVLSEMDTAEDFATDHGQAGGAGLCVLGLVGVCLLPLALPTFWYALLQTPFGDGSQTPAFFEGAFFRYALLPLGIVAPVVAMALGWAGKKQIQRSGGAMDGHAFAAIAYAGLPLLLINLIVLVVLANLFGSPHTSLPQLPVAPFSLVFIVVNLLVLRHIARKPAV